MNKVESFELDHRKVKAPYIRKCCLLNGPQGDFVTKFDIRFLQPNKEAFGTAAMDSYMESQESYQSLFEDKAKYDAIMNALAGVIYREMREPVKK